MDRGDWAGMFTYSLTILAVLMLVLGGFSSAKEDKTPVKEIELIQREASSTSFNEESLQLTVSGNTTVSSPDTSLRINSTAYNDGTLEIGLEGLQTNFSRPTESQQINYTLNVNMRSEMPDQVLVHGASETTKMFQP